MSYKVNDLIIFSHNTNVSWCVGVICEIIQGSEQKYLVRTESGIKYLITLEQVHTIYQFIEMWKEDWSRLSFNRVCRINLDEKKRFGMSYDFLPENTVWESSCSVDSIQEVPLDWKFSYQEYYHDYFGFASSKPMDLSFSRFGYKKLDVSNSSLDNFEDIYFNSKQYSCLDLDVAITGTFSKCGHHTSSSIPPKAGDIICGIVKRRKDNGKPYFKNWFVSSPEFYKLWLLVMADNNNFKCDKIINTLRTGDWLEVYDMKDRTEMERIDILKKKPLRTEPYSVNWTSIYQALACLYCNKIDHCHQYKLPHQFIDKFVNKLSSRVLNRRIK